MNQEKSHGGAAGGSVGREAAAASMRKARSAFCLHFTARVVVRGSRNGRFFSREQFFGLVTSCLLRNNFLFLGISI